MTGPIELDAAAEGLTEMIEERVEVTLTDRIRRAAEASGQPPQSWVAQVADEAAVDVLARERCEQARAEDDRCPSDLEW